jgi:hypothetical protein
MTDLDTAPGTIGPDGQRRRFRGDRGVIDAGVETLFGGVAMIALVLLLVETVSFWHARNVFDEAAAEGARVAAAFDGACGDGTDTARALITRRAGGWSSGVGVSCGESDGIVTVTISGSTPGVLFDAVGFRASVTQSAPKER